MEYITKNIFGKLFADKGYISKKLALICKKMVYGLLQNKKNSKTKSLMELSDKILLRKRSVIESVNDLLVFLKTYAR